MSAYVLIVLFIGGGFSAEFNDRISCIDAMNAITSTFAKGSATAFLSATCHAGGAPNGRANGK